MRLLFLARLCIGISAFCFAVASFPGTGAAGVGHLAASLCLLSVAFARGLRLSGLRALLGDRRLWFTGAALALTNVLGSNAVAFAELTTLAAISQTLPLWMVLLAPFFGDRVTRTDLLGLVLSTLGIAVVVGFSLSGQLLGISLALAGALVTALAMHQIGVRGRSGHEHDPVAWVGVMMLIGGVTLSLLQFRWDVSWGQLAFCAAAGILLGVANLSTLVTMPEVPASRAALLKPLSALLSAALGILFLGDTVTVSMLLGAALIGLAAWVINRGHRREGESPPGPVAPA